MSEVSISLSYLALFSILSWTINNASSSESCQDPAYCSTDSSNCTVYLDQSVTFVCECVYKNCTTTWKSNNNAIHFVSGPEYTLYVTNDIAGVMMCNSNSDTTFRWTVTVLPSTPPKFVKPLQGHSFNDESTSIGDITDPYPSCIICVNCSVTGDPTPVVTWEYQTDDNPGDFHPVMTNQSDPTSPYFVEKNGQRLCYNDIRHYESVNGITYQCTACNVVGSIYATFTSTINAYPLPEAGPLATRGSVYSGGHNVTLKMHTDYQVESTFRVCRYNRSSPNTLISCCYCGTSCKWGDLYCHTESGGSSCHLNTSHTGLYQFQIYTINYPCFFNIGNRIDVNDINNSSSSHEGDELILYIVISSLGLLLILLVVISTGYCARKHYRKRHTQTPRVGISCGDNDNQDEVPLNRPLLPAGSPDYGGVNNTSTVPTTDTSTVPVNNTSTVPAADTSIVPVDNTSTVRAADTSIVPVDNTSTVRAADTSIVPVDNTSAVRVADASATSISVTNNELSLDPAGAFVPPISADQSTSDEQLPLQATDDDETRPIPSTFKALAYHCKKTVYITNGDDSEQWVVDTLMPILTKLNVKVVRISDDAIPGREHYSARIDLIKEASKAIVVISKQLDKVLFDISRVLYKDSDPAKMMIIPILYGNVTDSDMPEQIKHLISIRNNDPNFAAKISKSIYS